MTQSDEQVQRKVLWGAGSWPKLRELEEFLRQAGISLSPLREPTVWSSHPSPLKVLRWSERQIYYRLDTNFESEAAHAKSTLWLVGDCTFEAVAHLAEAGHLLVPLSVSPRALATLICRRLRSFDRTQAFAERYLLSPQETQLIRCLMDGKRTEESAEVLGCKPQTLSSYWNRIFRKIGVRTQREILLRYIDTLETCTP